MYVGLEEFLKHSKLENFEILIFYCIKIFYYIFSKSPKIVILKGLILENLEKNWSEISYRVFLAPKEPLCKISDQSSSKNSKTSLLKITFFGFYGTCLVWVDQFERFFYSIFDSFLFNKFKTVIEMNSQLCQSTSRKILRTKVKIIFEISFV